MNATMTETQCLRCTKPASPGRKSCEKCRTYMRDHLHKRRAELDKQKLCLQYCGNERQPGATCCGACAERKVKQVAKDYKDLKKSGTCTDCGYRESIPTKTLCPMCAVKAACLRAGGTKADVPRMADMFDEQKHRCYLCGKSVVVGFDAEIEHVYYPRSRRTEFGTLCDDSYFWRWACKSCNSSKGARTLFEYQMDQLRSAFEVTS